MPFRTEFTLTYAHLTDLDRSGEVPIAVPLVETYVVPTDVAGVWRRAWQDRSIVTVTFENDSSRLKHIDLSQVAIFEERKYRPRLADGAPLKLRLLDDGRMALSLTDTDLDMLRAWVMPDN